MAKRIYEATPRCEVLLCDKCEEETKYDGVGHSNSMGVQYSYTCPHCGHYQRGDHIYPHIVWIRNTEVI